MKKYFIKETDELVELGDVIVVNLFKDLEDGKVTVDKEIKVTEDAIEGLIELDIIEEREEKPDLIDFSDDVSCMALDELSDKMDELEARQDALEEFLSTLTECLEEIRKALKQSDAKEVKKSSKK